MRIVTFSITICLIASTGVIHAQPDSLWTRNYGGNRQDDCCGVVQTADGDLQWQDGQLHSVGISG